MINSVNADKVKVIRTVKILLNSNFRLVAAAKPIKPKKNVTEDMHNTIYSGWICIELVTNSSTFFEDIETKKAIMQIKESINDQRLNLIFILASHGKSIMY